MKCFIQVWLGMDIPYWDKFVANRNLQKGWKYKIFTNLDVKGKGNVEVHKIDLDWFNKLLKDKLDIEPNIHFIQAPYHDPNNPIITQPSRHIYDYWPTFGYLFSEYLKGYEWWGHTCFDLVYGDLNTYFSDDFLKDCDIFGNDPDAICGPFSLYRNTPEISKLFMEVPKWKELLGSEDNDRPFDEHYMTECVRKARDEGRVNFKSGFYQDHGFEYDLKKEGIKLFNYGKETAMFHFNRGKVWPI